MALREIKHSLLAAHCASCTIYIVNPDLQKQLSKIDRGKAGSEHGIVLQRFAMEGGKWVDGVSTEAEGGKEMTSPSFKKPEDVKNGLKK